MSSWADFAADAPELAEHVRRTFAVRQHATLANAGATVTARPRSVARAELVVVRGRRRGSGPG